MNQVPSNHRTFALAALLCGAIACGGSSAGPSAGAASLKLASGPRLGDYLVDGSGRTLYYFAKDLPASGANAAVSNCSGACEAAWPVFHAPTAIVEGISSSDVSEITRADGSRQSTYLGWPLYFYAGDKKPGDTSGEAVSDIWFVLHARPYSIALMSNAAGQQPKLYLADGEGHSLYYFFHDTPGTATAAPVSACAAGCLITWPIFHADQPVVPSSLADADFTVFTRADGQKQSAYKGHPLYFFNGDASAGDTKGRGFNNAWDTLDPTVL
ncbi:MAG: hypothetical protein ACXWLR_08875 [Myxococcales bacterium]